jgi:hypothetical protein
MRSHSSVFIDAISDHVDPSPGQARGLRESGDIGAVGHVEPAGHCLAAFRTDLVGEFFQPVGAARAQHQPGAGGRQLAGNAGADAAGGSSDENDLVECHCKNPFVFNGIKIARTVSSSHCRDKAFNYCRSGKLS